VNVYLPTVPSRRGRARSGARTLAAVREAAAVPDVSVVVTAYNTRPYLAGCLRSLVKQTIGLDRLQIVVVDDGSTDGSGRLADRFARRYPGAFTVIHQANSGGPAGPCNRALDVASGRYVFFVGSDDYLGVDALRRLVAAADALGSDVVLGTVVGVNSRSIYQDIFARSATDIRLDDSPLPRSLANTKLFRRELLERHRIRYPEDLPVGSDLPFTLEACYRARRISVLADYEYYYLVRRLGAGNITYASRHARRVAAIEAMLTFASGLIEPGKQRDAVVLARFQHEIARLLDDTLLRVDRPTQRVVFDAVARMVATYLTDDIADRLGAETRVRTALVRHGRLDDLLAAIGQDARVGVPSTVVDGGRRFARYPGFREPGGPADACFDVTAAADWPVKLDATAVTRGGGRLTVTARTPVADLPALGVGGLTAHAEGIAGRVRVTSAGPDGTTVAIDFDVAELVAGSATTGQRRTVSVARDHGSAVDGAVVGAAVDGAAVDGAAVEGAAVEGAVVRAPRLARMAPLVRRRGARLYVVTATADDSGPLVLSVAPLTPRRILARLARRVRRVRRSAS
jgi:poly(ribitol-phosphate) beta-N-acetylglucosaminyltransferase